MKLVNFILYEFLPNQVVMLNGKEAVIEDIRVPNGLGWFEYKVSGCNQWLPGFSIDSK